MKRYALISLILLVAFMWSCENKSSSPYTPEDLTTLATNSGDGTVTMAGKGKGKGPRDKTATYTVDIYFGGTEDPVGSHETATMGNPNNLHANDMTVDLTVLNSLSPLKGCTTVDSPEGIFMITATRIIFFFIADDGVNYGLDMIGGLVEGTWPPSTDTTIFTGSELKLKFNAGDGKKNACEGTVTLPSGWTVVVTKNQPQSP